MGDAAEVYPIRRAITWQYIKDQLQCSRTTAYEYLKQAARAAGLPHVEGGLKRIDQHVWEQFYAEHFVCGCDGVARSSTRSIGSTTRTAPNRSSGGARTPTIGRPQRPSADSGNGMRPIPLPRERGRQR